MYTQCITHGLCGIVLFSVKRRDLSVARVFIPWPAGNGLLRAGSPSTSPTTRPQNSNAQHFNAIVAHSLLYAFSVEGYSIVWWGMVKSWVYLVGTDKYTWVARKDRATLEKHNNLMQFNCGIHFCMILLAVQLNCGARKLCCTRGIQRATLENYQLLQRLFSEQHLQSNDSFSCSFLPSKLDKDSLLKSPIFISHDYSRRWILWVLTSQFTGAIHIFKKYSLATEKWTPEQGIEGEADLHSLAVLLLLTLLKGALLD